MAFVTSKDGTQIGYSVVGSGPAIVLVDGAMCWRASGPAGPLAEQLKDRFTVYTYDRRGRGESGDTKPYATQREVEDLDAVIDAAGGSAAIYAISSGVAAGARGGQHARRRQITKMVLYEAPIIIDDTRKLGPDDYAQRWIELIARRRQRRRGQALHAERRRHPGVRHLHDAADGHDEEAGAGRPYPRLRHGVRRAVLDRQAAARQDAGRNVTMPVLDIGGGKSDAWMQNAQVAISKASAQRHAQDAAGPEPHGGAPPRSRR